MRPRRLTGIGRVAGGPWPLFGVLGLVLVALHVGVLWRALAREEDAVERAARAELVQHARTLEGRLAGELFEAERDLERGTTSPPRFAIRLRRTDDGRIELDGQPIGPSAPQSSTCDRQGLDFGNAHDDRSTRIAQLLTECPLARGPSGALLVPILAQAGEISAADWQSWRTAHPESTDTAALRRLESVITALGQQAERDHESNMLRIDIAEGRVRVRREEGAFVGWLVTPASLVMSVSTIDVDGLLLQPGERSAARLREAFQHGPFELVLSVANPSVLAARTARSRALVLGLSAASLLLTLGTALVLVRRITRLRRENELRVDFVAAVSHELRTPIASIRLLTDVLRREDLPADERSAAFTSLDESAQTLAERTERWLTLARLGKEGLGANRQPGDLARAIRTQVDRFENVHDTSISLEAPASASFDFDPMLVALVVDNLLDNARKYGKPPIGLSLATDTREARIVCTDHGPGFPADAGRLLLPFERGDTRLQKATEGVGLGLALVQAAASAHRGRVSLERTHTGGARVVVILEAA